MTGQIVIAGRICGARVESRALLARSNPALFRIGRYS